MARQHTLAILGSMALRVLALGLPLETNTDWILAGIFLSHIARGTKNKTDNKRTAKVSYSKITS